MLWKQKLKYCHGSFLSNCLFELIHYFQDENLIKQKPCILYIFMYLYMHGVHVLCIFLPKGSYLFWTRYTFSYMQMLFLYIHSWFTMPSLATETSFSKCHTQALAWVLPPNLGRLDRIDCSVTSSISSQPVNQIMMTCCWGRNKKKREKDKCMTYYLFSQIILILYLLYFLLWRNCWVAGFCLVQQCCKQPQPSLSCKQ